MNSCTKIDTAWATFAEIKSVSDFDLECWPEIVLKDGVSSLCGVVLISCSFEGVKWFNRDWIADNFKPSSCSSYNKIMLRQ